MMKVSIVIPVYNAEKYLQECIDSCLKQTYQNIEIIGVDDGSTDNSGKILESYSEKIKIIKKENGGTPSALNAGIKIMNGEWFKWLSADDVLYENAIEVLVKEAESQGERAKSFIFYSSYDIIDENSNVIGEFIEPNYKNLNSLQRNTILLDHYIGNGSTSLIHRSIFDRYGVFDESIGFKEDYEFWLRCCLINDCRLYLIPHKLAKYRIHETQLTRTKVRKNLDQIKMIRDSVLNKIQDPKREQYLAELKIYQRNKPLKMRIRRQLRDIMLKILPSNTSGAIIETYMNHKNPKN
jgi:glycosyltransferase involved in cell wall biosynthesis